MNFELTEDQLAIKMAARDFAENEIALHQLKEIKKASSPIKLYPHCENLALWE